MASEPAKCRSCGASIWWAQTKAGKPAPIDAEPNPEGNVVLTKSAAGTIKAEAYTAADHLPGRNRYTNHFVTCPQRRQWRKAS